jgi:hypothetical protein
MVHRNKQKKPSQNRERGKPHTVKLTDGRPAEVRWFFADDIIRPQDKDEDGKPIPRRGCIINLTIGEEREQQKLSTKSVAKEEYGDQFAYKQGRQQAARNLNDLLHKTGLLQKDDRGKIFRAVCPELSGKMSRSAQKRAEARERMRQLPKRPTKQKVGAIGSKPPRNTPSPAE